MTRGTSGSFNKITTIYVHICPPIISVEKKQSQREKAGLEFHFFIFITEHFVEFTGSDIKKLILNAGPESKKKSTKFLLSTCDTKINGRVMN